MRGVRYKLRIDAATLTHLRDLLSAEPGKESAAFVLAGVHQLPGTVVFLARRVVEVPATEYVVRTADRIELSSRAINGLAALCEANGLTALVAHSHPGGGSYSPSDDHGESRIAGTLRAFTPRPEIGSILITSRAIHARVWYAADEQPVDLDEIAVLGSSIQRIQPQGNLAEPPIDETYSRQILAFGRAGQRAIARLKVGIVGTGGTGSPLAEQLVRLGVRDLTLVDRDEFDPSNLSRVSGSTARDARPPWWRRVFRAAAPKVEIVARHLRVINPEARIETVYGDVTQRSVATRLLDRDVLFACTDEHWGRSILNQIAYQYLIPTFNLGMAITSEGGEITAGVGVVQSLRPGHGCLWCSGYLNSDRIRAESLPAGERASLAAEGYLVGIDEPAPSIVTVTTTVAALAGTWLIQLATGFMGEAGDHSRLNYDLTTGTVRRGRVPSLRDCICQKVKGRGDMHPLPL